MLATLETGIEGGKWFRLIDKVWSPKNLGLSLEKVVAKGGSAGIDKQNARQIEVHKDQTIAKLEQELRSNQYQPQAVKRVWIPKGLVWKIVARDFETVSRCCPARLTSIFARRLSGFTFEKDAHVFRVFEAGKLCDRFQGEISFH